MRLTELCLGGTYLAMFLKGVYFRQFFRLESLDCKIHMGVGLYNSLLFELNRASIVEKLLLSTQFVR